MEIVKYQIGRTKDTIAHATLFRNGDENNVNFEDLEYILRTVTKEPGLTVDHIGCAPRMGPDTEGAIDVYLASDVPGFGGVIRLTPQKPSYYTFLEDHETFGSESESAERQGLFVVDDGNRRTAYKILDLYNVAKRAMGRGFDLLAVEVPESVDDELGDDEDHDREGHTATFFKSLGVVKCDDCDLQLPVKEWERRYGKESWAGENED